MTRKDEVKAERRRRSDTMGGRNRLHVPEELLDRENFEYRWANDTPERMHELTVRDDWDVVSDRDNAKGGNGSEMAEQVGAGVTGSPLRAVLVRKPKKYHDEDKLKKQRKIDDQENDLKRNAAPGTDSTNLYQPKTETKISRG